LYKNLLCRYFDSGFCPQGSNCTFAHGLEELRPPRTLTSNDSNIPCRTFSAGKTCLYGTNCRFSHSES
jgi:CCCH zinc finger protein C3H-4